MPAKHAAPQRFCFLRADKPPEHNRHSSLLCAIVMLLLICTSQSTAGFESFVHVIHSDNQSADTTVRVLLPDRALKHPPSRRKVIYVLPVEAGETTQWGDPLAEILRQDLHNRHNVVCVLPAFSDLPWYADHPENPRLRQETFLLQDVIPWVEQNYFVRGDRAGRLLVGFSKSGWGAWSLLLRHPAVFERAAAFDAPLMMDRPGRFGSGQIFATDDNFRNYQVSRLLRMRANDLRQSPPRLMLLGIGNFQEDHRRAELLLRALQIPFYTDDVGERAHSWNSGWLNASFWWLLKD